MNSNTNLSEYRKLLLSELRFADYCDAPRQFSPDECTEERLNQRICKAATVNENLLSLGFRLAPQDILRLASSSSLDTFFEQIASLMEGDFPPPMYPDFPRQVMAMDKAQLRMHQCMHYFSTYGLEDILGVKISHGWLPSVDSTPKSVDDDILLNAKTIKLIPQSEMYIIPAKRLLERKESMTDKELSLVRISLSHIDPAILSSFQIVFKKNLLDVFWTLFIREAPRSADDFNHASHHAVKDAFSQNIKHFYKYAGILINSFQHISAREKLYSFIQNIHGRKDACEPSEMQADSSETEVRKSILKGVKAFCRRTESILKSLDNKELQSKFQSFAQTVIELGGLSSEDAAQDDVLSKFRQDKLQFLKSICKHTGDVFKALDYVLMRKKFHLKTSEKRLLVKLLESYPVNDFRENLILSSKKRERSLLVLQYLDYNIYSRSSDHKQAVFDLRNGSLRSWKSRAKFLIESNSPNALDYISKRPGMLLRMVSYLLKRGYSPAAIEACLMKQRNALSIQTMISILTAYGKPEDPSNNQQPKPDDKSRMMDILKKAYPQKYAQIPPLSQIPKIKTDREYVYEMIERVLTERLKSLKTPLYKKSIFIDMEEFNLDRSSIQLNEKSKEGGYIRSGLAYKIPDNVRRVRFFVYWNDPERVDIDLHASGIAIDGREITVGWDTELKDNCAVHSGDITHSNAAEYIDIDLNSEVSVIETRIHLFSGKSSFRQIEKCFVGMMAVKNFKENVKLYSPANAFFTHYLTSNSRFIHYGYIDAVSRCLVFRGIAASDWNKFRNLSFDTQISKFSLKHYIRLLAQTQHCIFADCRENADIVLVMAKPKDSREISLIDSDFFLGT